MLPPTITPLNWTNPLASLVRSTTVRPTQIILLILFSISSANANPPVTSLLEMRHENVVVQEWDLSCGAAALATLLRFQHGDPVPERDIALELVKREEYVDNPTLLRVRQGFSLLDLKRYVDDRGYEGIGYGQLALEDLADLSPIMVPVNFNGYNHFVVYRGRIGNRVLIADPAWGNRTMMADDFISSWIDYDGFGRVGFIVNSSGHISSVDRLIAKQRDFFFLR